MENYNGFAMFIINNPLLFLVAIFAALGFIVIGIDLYYFVSQKIKKGAKK